MLDFDRLYEQAMAPYPFYRRIVQYKQDLYTNQEIQNLLEAEFGQTHSIEYLSFLWRNKIPKLIAQQASDNFLEWYFTFKAYGKWKRCNRCGQIKLAHPRYFSTNKTSKDGFYSLCKECRNKKKVE